MSSCPQCAGPGEHLAIMLPFEVGSLEPVTVLHRCPSAGCAQGLWQEPVRDARAIAIRASAALGRFMRTSGLVAVGTIRPGRAVHPEAEEHAASTRVGGLPAAGGGLEHVESAKADLDAIARGVGAGWLSPAQADVAVRKVVAKFGAPKPGQARPGMHRGASGLRLELDPAAVDA